MLKDTFQTLYPGILSVLVIIWIGYMKKRATSEPYDLDCIRIII